MEPHVLQLLIVLLLIVLNAFFALSEMAVMTSRKSRLRQMAEHSRGARKALALAEHPDHLLSTVQIGITLIGVLTGLVGGEAGAWFGEAVTLGAQPARERANCRTLRRLRP